ncbi:hypothetical protein D3C78_1514790 [compost metagenome]
MRNLVESALVNLEQALESFKLPGQGSFVGFREAERLLNKALEKPKPCNMVRLDRAKGVVINLADISSLRFNTFNGSSCLDIHMNNGDQHRVGHWPYGDGTDIYELHRQIVGALGCIN